MHVYQLTWGACVAGGGGGGCGNYDCGAGTDSSSSACDSSITECLISGTGNWNDNSGLSYDGGTGKFSGTFVSNFCPNHPSEGQTRTPDCKEQAIPDNTIPNIAGLAKTPLLGRIAMSLSGGV